MIGEDRDSQQLNKISTDGLWVDGIGRIIGEGKTPHIHWFEFAISRKEVS